MTSRPAEEDEEPLQSHDCKDRRLQEQPRRRPSPCRRRRPSSSSSTPTSPATASYPRPVSRSENSGSGECRKPTVQLSSFRHRRAVAVERRLLRLPIYRIPSSPRGSSGENGSGSSATSRAARRTATARTRVPALIHLLAALLAIISPSPPPFGCLAFQQQQNVFGSAFGTREGKSAAAGGVSFGRTFSPATISGGPTATATSKTMTWKKSSYSPRRPRTGTTTTTTTRRHMVLTTPEAIIEQASTQNLLDDLIDESVRTSARRPIMMQFDPSSGWIWKRWKGTIFSETWDSCVSKMAYALIIFFVCKSFPSIKDGLSGFNVLWGQLLSVTTFTLTFFVNQSYALWRKCYELSRRLQGRLHDLDMTLAGHATRKPPASPNEPSTYTAASRQILELVSRYVRLFNLLTYASFTRSHRPILTPRGMRRLVERGLMTSQERHVLIDAEIPATQRHNAVLLWIIRTFVEGCEAGHFLGGAGFEEQFMEKIHVCRAQYGAIGDELQGRMPLAYAHIVQVLVDMILWMYPFMAISSGFSGFLCVVGTGLLTVSYQGLFDLAKQFLDPYDNESYGRGEDPLVVDTLIAETNAGSVRWMYGLEEYPVSPQRIVDGELSDYLLPIRGYSVEELAQMEEERLERERELQEKREKEEEERRKAEEEERRLREAAEAMTGALIVNEAEYNYPVSALLSNVTYSFFPTSGNVGVNGARRGAASSAGSRFFPGTVKKFSKAVNVSSVLDMLPYLGEDLLEAVVPDGTAPSVPEIICEEKDEEAVEQKIVHEEDDEDDEDEFFEYDLDGIDIDSAETPYVHKFDSFEPYADLPWFDGVDADGKEIRLSQLLADEVWEEELEAQREKEPQIHTYEEYTKRAAEIIDARESELLETKEILMESPGSQSSSLPLKDEADRVPKYDQTKLDGFSQLWGLPPDEISEIPGYQEPFVAEGEGDAREIGQLWGGGPTGTSLGNTPDRETAEGSFGTISQLWGEDLDAEDQMVDEMLSSSGTRRIKDETISSMGGGTRSIKDDVMDQPHTLPHSPEYEPRMSQMLADEVWPEELDATPMVPATFEDYTKQVKEILDAEEVELLETQAIMNAPPGADSVDVPEKPHDEDSLLGTNSTSEVDLSVLEMDEPQNAAFASFAPKPMSPSTPPTGATQAYLSNLGGRGISSGEDGSTGEDGEAKAEGFVDDSAPQWEETAADGDTADATDGVNAVDMSEEESSTEEEDEGGDDDKEDCDGSPSESTAFDDENDP